MHTGIDVLYSLSVKFYNPTILYIISVFFTVAFSDLSYGCMVWQRIKEKLPCPLCYSHT